MLLPRSKSRCRMSCASRAACRVPCKRTFTLYGVIVTHQFSPDSSQQTPHSSPMRARWVSFLSLKADSFSAAVIALLYVIPWYIAPHYNGTQLDIIFIFWLWFNDAICHHRSGSILVQVMACCLAAPSHYMNHCWLAICEVLWHSLKGNVYLNT